MKKQKRGNALRILLTVLCIGVFLFSLGMVLKNVFSAQESKEIYAELEQLVEEPLPEAPPPSPLEKYGALAERNKDFIGWLSIEGTPLNYPVMQRKEEKNYYLRRHFDGGYSYYGTPYLDEDCDLQTSDNLVIYGHNMDNGTMFAELRHYTDPAYFREHPIIHFDTLETFGRWQVIAAFKTTADSDGFAYHTMVDAESKEVFDAYVSRCKTLSFYDTGHTAEYGTQLLTLSTCEYTRNNGRLVILAKRIGE